MTAEEWRPVIGHPDYEVSSFGRVRSYKQSRSPRIIRPGSDSHGYPTVRLHMDGRGRLKRVHSIVARAFLGCRPEGAHTRHLDGDKTNNRLANLAYGSQQENVLDSVRHGTHYEASKTHCPQFHEYTPENTARVGPGGRKRRCRTCHRAQVRAHLERQMLRASGIPLARAS